MTASTLTETTSVAGWYLQTHSTQSRIFNSNQHNHQQAALTDSLVGVSPVLQFCNLYSSYKQHFQCIAAFLIHVNMWSVSLDVITSLF